MNTPLRTPIKQKCPKAPFISRIEKDNFLPITPIKLFNDEEIKCPDPPRKKRVCKKRLIITNNGQIVGSFPLILSNNDDINSCRRSLFPEKPSKIPRLIKKVKTPSKFADSLERKIKEDNFY